MARGKYRLVLPFLLMNGALPGQPVEGVLEVSNTLIFYAEGGAFPSATDQSPKVDDGGGADVVFRVHRIHRKLDWDAGNGFTSFCDIGFNNLEREEGLGRCQLQEFQDCLPHSVFVTAMKPISFFLSFSSYYCTNSIRKY